jgi:hypothetical protein
MIAIAIAVQGADGSESLQLQFDRAVSAKGEAYFTLRSNILAWGASAVPFLTEQASSTNLHARVLARAMLSWTAQPELNRRRTELIERALSPRISSHLPRISAVLGETGGSSAYGTFTPPQEDELRRKDAVPFLLEMVLKGPSDTQRPAFKEGVWARCFAAGLVGWYTGPDVVPVLAEELGSGDGKMPVAAVAGLGCARTYAAVEPLLGALSAQNDDVRASAYVALMDITGQDFRKGRILHTPPVTSDEITDAVREQFRAWWQDNKARLLGMPAPQEKK